MPERASLISLFTGSGVTNLDDMRALYNRYGNGGSIHIDPSKKGTFTAAAKRHGMGVQEFASHVLSNKDNYSSVMVRKANFARNAAKWHEDGGELNPSEQVTFSDQSRRGLRRVAREAVFSDNPYKPDENDTFLEDYLKDNNIVSFDNKRAKRIFDRSIKRNLRLKESLLDENGHGVVPTIDSGYSAVYGPNGRQFVRSEKPLVNEDAVMLAFVPAGNGATMAENAASTIGRTVAKLSPRSARVALGSYRKIASPIARIDHAMRPSTYLAKLMNNAGFAPETTAGAGLVADMGAYNVVPGLISYKKYLDTGDESFKGDMINSALGIIPNIIGKYSLGASYMDDYVNRLNGASADRIFNNTTMFDSSLANPSSFRARPKIRKVSRLDGSMAEYDIDDNVVNLPYVNNVFSFKNIGNPRSLDATLSHEFQHALTRHSPKSAYTVPSDKYYTAADGYKIFGPFYKNRRTGLNWESSPSEFISEMAGQNYLMGTSGKRLDDLNWLQRRNYIKNMSDTFHISRKDAKSLIESFEAGYIY